MPTIKLSPLVLVNKQSGMVIIPANTPLTRLNYFDGKFLRAQDLKLEQDYLRQLVRESNQAGGPGVAHGFDLTEASGDALHIGPGLAIDPQGRVLLLPQEVNVGVQELIDKSRDLQRLFGKVPVAASPDFGDCELHNQDPQVDLHQAGDLFLIVVSSAEALCGEEDVYGKLCEEACVTSTDRPYIIEGVTIRAVPLPLTTALPAARARNLTQVHLRSRVAAAYFEQERRRGQSSISGSGLKQQVWCLDADGPSGSGVAIGVLARAGSETVFLDPWIPRRERLDPPAKRYWQWRMMMRPWDVFLAQVLQFQCQLHDIYLQTPVVGKLLDPCGGARGVINEAAATIADLKEFYRSTTERFTALKVNLEEAITFQGGLTRLTDLNQKLITVSQTLGLLPQDEFLLRNGIVELPPAGYLPVTTGDGPTINQQVRRLMGEGVDLRFCVVRPDYVAHALEEAQHLERISLLTGLDDPEHKPQVDILIPDGEVLEQKLLSPGTGFEASVDVAQNLIQKGDDSKGTLNLRGVARIEKLATGGGAFYMSCERQLNFLEDFNSIDVSPTVDAVAPTSRPAETINSSADFIIAPSSAKLFSASVTPNILILPRFALWMSLHCYFNLFTLSRGATTPIDASVTVVGNKTSTPLLDLQFNGMLQVNSPTSTSGQTKIVSGRIANASLTYGGVKFSTDGSHKTTTVDLDVTVTLTGESAIEVILTFGRVQLVLQADWNSQPLNVSATVIDRFVLRNVGVDSANAGAVINRTVMVDESAISVKPASGATLAHADLTENPEVLSDKNTLHVQAVEALELIAKILNDVTFADAKRRLLFPAPPKPTDELLVRGTLDWVMFHRRRTKRCSQEVCVPPVAPARQYQVYHLALASIDDVDAARKKLIDGGFPESALNQLPLVNFEGGAPTLLTDPQAWRTDWANVQPGNSLVYAGMANRDSAAADGNTLALSRLSRLIDALAPVSVPDSRMQPELLNQIPSTIPASSVDGVIFLFTVKAADLRLTKDGPAQITTPGEIIYTIKVTNAGPEAAKNAVVKDQLPEELALLSAKETTNNGWTQPLAPAGMVVFSKVSVPSNETSEFQVVAAVKESTPGVDSSVINTATVTADTSDPDAANNSGKVATVLKSPPKADLHITKTAELATNSLGQQIITFRLVVGNDGPSSAEDVTVTDTLPPHTTFQSARLVPDTGTDWSPAPLPPFGGSGKVIFSKNLVPKGDTATLEIVVRVDDLTETTEIINTAEIASSKTDDPKTDNNQSKSTTTVTPLPVTFEITKSGPDEFSFNETLSYTLKATNNGPGTAHGVVIRDSLPAEAIFVSQTKPDSWAVTLPTSTDHTIRFNKDSMNPGETAEFKIELLVPFIVTHVISGITNNVSIDSKEAQSIARKVSRLAEVRKKGLLIFATLRGTSPVTRVPQQGFPQTPIDFVNNGLSDQKQIESAIKGIPATSSLGSFTHLTLATVLAPPDADAKTRADGVMTAVNNNGGAITGDATEFLSANDRKALGTLDLKGFDEIIYLERKG